MSERVNKNCAQRAGKPWFELLSGSNGRFYRQSCYGTPMTLPLGWREPAGSLCCWSNTEPSAHMALTDCGIKHSHTSTGSVHTSLQTRTCLLCSIITSLSLKRTFHTLAPPVEWVVGLMPNALHYPSCSGFCIYLRRWRCRCCWRLFCTGPEQEPCGGGGRSADPTETPIKDHFTLSHLYQLNLLWI